MCPRLPRALVLLASALMPALCSPEASAYLGHGRAIETVYVPSSASVLLEPTAYYVPTSYSYVPTVYTTTAYVPTRYVLTTATAYIRPTTYYAPTRYVVRRPVVTTSRLVDTAYYLPTTTTLDLPVIRTSSAVACCDPEPVICDDVIGGAGETILSEEPVYAVPESSDLGTSEPLPAPGASGSTGAGTSGSGSAAGAGGEPPLDEKVLRSEPTRPTTRQTDSPPPPQGAVSPPSESVPAVPPEANPADPGVPVEPAPDLEIPLPPPADEVDPLVPPAVDQPGPATETQPRESLRPTYSRPLAQARSVLVGKVLSGANGEAQTDVLVTLTDRSGRFVARTATTDEAGAFSVVLPEGDWTVSIPRADNGEDVTAGYLTVSGGVITDEQNREVSTLTINR